MSLSRRDFSTGAFSRNPYTEPEEADPRVGLVNLADVMLVFAAGLMCALVMNWGVSLSGMTEVSEMTELSEDEVAQMNEQMESVSVANYQERGMVYEDPTTGQLYLLESTTAESDEGSAASDAEASSGESAEAAAN